MAVYGKNHTEYTTCRILLTSSLARYIQQQLVGLESVSMRRSENRSEVRERGSKFNILWKPIPAGHWSNPRLEMNGMNDVPSAELGIVEAHRTDPRICSASQRRLTRSLHRREELETIAHILRIKTAHKTLNRKRHFYETRESASLHFLSIRIQVSGNQVVHVIIKSMHFNVI
jgi:hypothetical protein